MKKIIVFFLSFFLIISSAFALKISSRQTINFEPGLVYNGKVCVWPSEIKRIQLTPMGELADNIDLPYTDLDMTEGPGCVPYNLTLPQEFEEPGIHKTAIRASEISPDTQTGQIVALVHVDHQIWVDVPYPGKYLEVSFSASNAEAGSLVKLNARVTSKGEETIQTITGFATIYNQDDEQVGRAFFEPATGLQSQGSTTLTTYWNSSGNTVGDYRAVLSLDYDGKEAEKEDEFKLGSVEVRITGHTESVYKKGIVPFNVRTESYWSQPISNVKAIVKVLNGSEQVTEFETLSQNLEPWEEKGLKGYLDTNNLEYYNYSLNISLMFEGETRTYDGSLEVKKEPVPVEESPQSSFLNYFNNTKALLTTTIILALITLLLIIKVFFVGKKKEDPVQESNP